SFEHGQAELTGLHALQHVLVCFDEISGELVAAAVEPWRHRARFHSPTGEFRTRLPAPHAVGARPQRLRARHRVDDLAEKLLQGVKKRSIASQTYMTSSAVMSGYIGNVTMRAATSIVDRRSSRRWLR